MPRGVPKSGHRRLSRKQATVLHIREKKSRAPAKPRKATTHHRRKKKA